MSEPREDSRKLVFYDRKNDVRYLLVKPTDVPVYVDHGVAWIWALWGRIRFWRRGAAL